MQILQRTGFPDVVRGRCFEVKKRFKTWVYEVQGTRICGAPVTNSVSSSARDDFVRDFQVAQKLSIEAELGRAVRFGQWVYRVHLQYIKHADAQTLAECRLKGMVKGGGKRVWYDPGAVPI